jgi:hypothetical protein
MHKSDEELEQIIREAWQQLTEYAGRMRHKKSGTVYRMENVVLNEATLDVLVVYRVPGSPVAWVRPLPSVLTSFEPCA